MRKPFLVALCFKCCKIEMSLECVFWYIWIASSSSSQSYCFPRNVWIDFWASSFLLRLTWKVILLGKCFGLHVSAYKEHWGLWQFHENNWINDWNDPTYYVKHHEACKVSKSEYEDFSKIQNYLKQTQQASADFFRSDFPYIQWQQYSVGPRRKTTQKSSSHQLKIKWKFEVLIKCSFVSPFLHFLLRSLTAIQSL